MDVRNLKAQWLKGKSLVRMLVLSLSSCVTPRSNPYLTEPRYSLSTVGIPGSGARPLTVMSQLIRALGKCYPLVLQCVKWWWMDLSGLLWGHLSLLKPCERKAPDSQKVPGMSWKQWTHVLLMKLQNSTFSMYLLTTTQLHLTIKPKEHKTHNSNLVQPGIQ